MELHSSTASEEPRKTIGAILPYVGHVVWPEARATFYFYKT